MPDRDTRNGLGTEHGACPTCQRPYPRVKVQDYERPTEAELRELAPSGSRWANPWDDRIAVSLGVDPNWADPAGWHEDYVPEPQLIFKVTATTPDGFDDVFSVPCTHVRDGGIYTRISDE